MLDVRCSMFPRVHGEEARVFGESPLLNPLLTRSSRREEGAARFLKAALKNGKDHRTANVCAAFFVFNSAFHFVSELRMRPTIAAAVSPKCSRASSCSQVSCKNSSA